MKSTQSCIPAKRKGKRIRLLTMLGGLLLLFPLLLPATALAAPRSAAATPPLTKPQQIVDLAGVSVVRLFMTYFLANGSSEVLCTTLGTIIASWPAQNANDTNNWVLTDGSLLNPSTKNTCALGGKLATITIFASNEFTNTQTNAAQLGLLNCTTSEVCTDNAGVNGPTGPVESFLTTGGSAVLFSFHTDNPLPYVDVEKAATTGLPAPISIELANSNNGIPPSAINVDSTTLAQFLTPIANVTVPGSAPATPGTTGAQTTEPGMPYIDGNGKITGMQLSTTTSLVTISDIENLENQIVLPPGQTLSQLLNKNTLSQQWDTGIIEYEQGNNSAAVQTLSSIKNAPTTFQAPAAFIKKAQAKLPTNNGTPGTTPAATNGQSNHGSFSFFGIPLLVMGLIAAGLALVLLFVLVSLTFGSGRLERINNNKEKTSSVFIQTQLGRLHNLFNKFKQALQTHAPDSNSLNPHTQHPQRTPSYTLCPNCSQAVPNGVAFCPNCRYPLLPDTQNARPVFKNSPASVQPIVAAPLLRNNNQPQPPVQAPKMQDDPAILAALQRLWDKAGR